MKFRYLGKKEDMKVFGYDFTNGAIPNVTEEAIITKLSGNSHFEAVKKGEKKPVGIAAEADSETEITTEADSETEWPV